MEKQILNESIWAYLLEHPELIFIIIWSVIWKAIALWKSARNNHLLIFITFSVLNLFGIPEIIYLIYLHLKNKKQITTTVIPPIIQA
jgi:uncharacterized membrane protein